MSERRLKIACVIGTRPEAIKMAPILWALKQQPWADVAVWSTAQHRGLLDDLLSFLRISVDYDFDLMTPNQSLSSLASRVMREVDARIIADAPELIVAQGDTTTVMATALAAFHARTPFAHVEAGLRTGSIDEPFPEELNRILATRVATLNFAPTERTRHNLLREGTDPASVWVTGNTVIDTLLDTRQRLRPEVPSPVALHYGQRLMLVTLHRRESFGDGLARVFTAIGQLVARFPELVVLYPVHPNPNVSGPAHAALGAIERVHLTAPLDYPDLVRALDLSTVVLTDSGGLQEEAPALGKPVFVARSTTERPEAVELGCAQLVGTDTATIVDAVSAALTDPAVYDHMNRVSLPYGDGFAAQRIVGHIAEWAEARGIATRPHQPL